MIILNSHSSGCRYQEQVSFLVDTIRLRDRVFYYKQRTPVRFFPVEFFWIIKISFTLLFLKFFRTQKKILLVGHTEQLYITFLSQIFGLRVYWLLLEPSQFQGWRALLYKHVAKNAEIIIFSLLLFKNQKEQYGLAPKKVHHIKPVLILAKGRQENLFHEIVYKQYAESYQRNFILGVITNLVAHSGVEHLLQVVKMLTEQLPNIQLIVIGNGPEKKNLLWLAKNMRLDQHIRIIASTQDIHTWMKGFTVFLYTNSRDVSWYIPEILLAMHYAKPIIAQKTPYTKELLRNTKEAILLDITNKEMVAQVIINMANHPDWLEQLSANVRQRAREVLAGEEYETNIKEIFAIE